MKNTVTTAQVNTWEALAEAQNSRDGVEALSCYYVDRDGDSCPKEDGVAVCFEAVDYDNDHDYGTLRALLLEAGVELEELTLDMSRGDFCGDLYTADVERDRIPTRATLFTITLPLQRTKEEYVNAVAELIDDMREGRTPRSVVFPACTVEKDDLEAFLDGDGGDLDADDVLRMANAYVELFAAELF